MKEAHKSVLTCAIGTVFGLIVMLIVAPELLWFGMLASFAGGYVIYEFKQVLQAIPVAWEAAGGIGVEFAEEIRIFFYQKHPFLYPALVLAVWPTIMTFSGINWTEVWNSNRQLYTSIVLVPGYYTMYTFWLMFGLVGLAYIGAKYGEKCFWYPFFKSSHPRTDKMRIEQNEAEGLSQALATYNNVARWIAKGILLCLYGIARKLPVALLKLGWQGLGLLRRFLVHLFKLIHSQERVACGTYCAIGVAVSHIWLTPLGNPVILLIGGALIGAALGRVSWKLTSKRWLDVAEA